MPVVPQQNRTDGGQTEFVDENRCWPCTVANAVVGVLVALVPLLAALIEGSTALIAGTTVWAVAVIGFTGYHLIKQGYLPLAQQVATATGLHERIGPGSKTDTEREDSRR